MSQIMQHYLTKEGCMRKLFYCLIGIKQRCIKKCKGLRHLKVLGILQTEMEGTNPESKTYLKGILYHLHIIKNCCQLEIIKLAVLKLKCLTSALINFDDKSPKGPDLSLHQTVYFSKVMLNA